MPTQLKNLKVHEVSGVDAAANRRTFLLKKSAARSKGAPMATLQIPAALVPFFKSLGDLFSGGAPTLDAAMADQYDDERINSLCCGLSDAIDQVLDSEPGDKRTAVIGLLQQFLTALDQEGFLKSLAVEKAGRKISTANLKTLTDMHGQLTKLIASASGQPGPDNGEEDPEAPKKPVGKGQMPPADEEQEEAPPTPGKPPTPKKPNPDNEEETPMDKAQEQALIKSVDDLTKTQADLTKANTDLTERLKKAEDDLAKANADKQDEAFMAKARAIGPVPGSTFEQTAALLKSVAAAGNADQMTATESMLKASADAARQSPAFHEVGKGGGGTNAGGGVSTFISKSQELAKSASIGIADAMERVAKEDPTAYNEYRAAGRK